jgi:TolB-like protein
MKKSIMGLAMLLLAGICFAQNTLVVVPLQNRGGQGLSADVETITELLGNAVVRTGRFDVVDRAALEDLMKEHQFQMDDWSNETKSVEMGRVLNANFIVRGQVSRLGSQMIVSARILDVNTARILGTSEMQLTSMDEAYGKMDALVKTLTNDIQSTRRPAAASSQPNKGANDTQQTQNIAGTNVSYEDFTTGQRWGTWGLNWLIPGLGSYVIMKDKVGGTIQLGVGIVGYACLIIGASSTTTTSSSSGSTSSSETSTSDEGMAIAAIGGVLLISDFIFNCVRSGTYHKPQPKTASLVDPNAWNIAVLPGEDGIEKVHLSYTMRY